MSFPSNLFNYLKKIRLRSYIPFSPTCKFYNSSNIKEVSPQIHPILLQFD